MSAITTILSGCLAVSAAGIIVLSRSDPASIPLDIPEPELRVVIAEPVVPALQVVADPEPEPLLYSVDFPETQAIRQIVQPIEERGDAMLFEIEALRALPFDEAITMPFD